MKRTMKQILALLVSATMVMALLVACASGGQGNSNDGANSSAGDSGSGSSQGGGADSSDQGGSGDGISVGMAFSSLSNPVYAEVVQEAKRYGEELGMKVTYVDAGEDSAMQISQIENFIQSGMDVIITLAIDRNAVEDVCAKAQESGIIVIDYSRGVEHASASVALDPEATGEALVQHAYSFLKDIYGDEEFEWGLLDIQTVELGVRESVALKAEFERLMPNGKLVASASTLAVDEGMANTEAMLQAHPDMRVILACSAGAGVGANEAIKALVSPDEYDDYYLFGLDATEQELVNILNGDPQKTTISLGGGADHGRQLIDLTIRALNGEELEYEQGLPILPISIENAQEYYDTTYGK